MGMRAILRVRDARAYSNILRPGGMILLDNSDWLPMSTRCLREAGLLEVDMAGLIPLSNHAKVTSFFFTRNCNIVPEAQQHPALAIGGIPNCLEKAGKRSQVDEVKDGVIIHHLKRQAKNAAAFRDVAATVHRW